MICHKKEIEIGLFIFAVRRNERTNVRFESLSVTVRREEPGAPRARGKSQQ